MKPEGVHSSITYGAIIDTYFNSLRALTLGIVCGIITHPESVIGILSNLISNAIKYSPDNTEITVLSKVTDNEWELVVRDQGPGFSEQDFEDIFKPFAKLSASPTGDETSTGVGLYSAKTSIDRLNGQIDINRAYEDGAEFICRIPVELTDEQLETV